MVFLISGKEPNFPLLFASTKPELNDKKKVDKEKNGKSNFGKSEGASEGKITQFFLCHFSPKTSQIKIFMVKDRKSRI